MLCFIHIEKAAGTTLHRVFTNNYPHYVHLKSWHFWSNSEDNDFSRRECRHLKRMLPWISIIGGHGLRAYLHYQTVLGEPVRYFTFLRDPVSRYVSHFRYHRDVMRIGVNLEDFVSERRFNNFMTQRISPDGDLEEAKRALREDFAFVGLMEDFDRSLVLLKERLDLGEFDTRYEISNASSGQRKSRDEQLAAPLREKILANNALDLELYRYVRQELFPSYVQAAGNDFEDRVRRHLEATRDFHFSRSREILSSFYLKAVHRPVEKIVRSFFHRGRRAA